VIETKKLTKRYGNLIAANEVDLNLDDGDVFGFIGPNGSGKTTTMRMLATLLNPDYGEACAASRSTPMRRKFGGWWGSCPISSASMTT
jgi:ABC-2 type transport system ATP-binding protein